jgi:S-disulfanyl-L-cysteine oxidoreductase SoxD
MSAEPRSVLDGVYSKEQAARGKSVYNQECAKFHSQNLGGGEDSPELAGSAFREQWKGKTVGGLYEITRKTMPTDAPGTLSRNMFSVRMNTRPDRRS